MAQHTQELPADLADALKVSLREGLILLERIAEEQGIDIDAIRMPPKVIAERARRVAKILDASGLRSVEAIVVRMKIARLEDQLDEPEADEIYQIDTVPNLLLLERLIEELQPLTAAALREELSPLFKAIDARLRGAMELLIETGLAPSPFCIAEVVEDGGPARSSA